MSTASARQYDTNGWPEIKRNPISKVGVFPYSGKQIDHDGALGLDPNKVYAIYRPPEELSRPETLQSFKLIPFVDEHTMLGPGEAGLTPAERKGIHGVLGEEVEFDGTFVRTNLKIFSDYLAANVQAGKREVSAGYRCRYDMTPGEVDGMRYDGVQRDILGNHLALVEEGRMGPEVAVLDSKMTFSFDAKEATKMAIDVNSLTLADLVAVMKAAAPVMKEIKGLMGGEEVEAVAGDTPAAPATETPAAAAVAAPTPGTGEDSKAKPAAPAVAVATPAAPVAAPAPAATVAAAHVAMDEAAIVARVAARDGLAERLSWHVGAFDHKALTLAQVEAYGLDKLGLKDKVPAGQDAATYLRGFLDASDAMRAPRAAPVAATGADGKPVKTEVDAYLTAAPAA